MSAHVITVAELRVLLTDIQGQDEDARQGAQQQCLEKLEPLLRKWAWQEQRREASQHRHVDFEDVLSVVVVNTLRALHEIKPERLRTSAVNYLYNLVITRTRRELSQTYSNVRFPDEFLVNARRVRSITDSLRDELGRQPTDDEIIERSRLRQSVDGIQMGSQKANAGKEFREPLTQRFLDAYRQHEILLAVNGYGDETTLHGLADTQETPSIEGELLALVYHRAARMAGIDDTTSMCLWSTFGIEPFSEPGDRTEVGSAFNMDSKRIRELVRCWMSMCRTPQSAFHEALTQLDDSALEASGAEDILSNLGPFEPEQREPAPESLLNLKDD